MRRLHTPFKLRFFPLFWCVALLVFSLTLSFIHPLHIHAGIEDTGVDDANGETLGTNPKSRTMNVTASVRDLIPPSVPILVSPPDGSLLTTLYPTFIWEPSTDEQGIGKYQLYLDGSILFDNIPLSSTTNSEYTLVVEDGEMKLTPNGALSQGTHTWKIVVYDIYDNTNESATWSFTIDTLGPTTVVTQVGDQTTTITSDDASTVPLTPLRLNQNEPIISGTSETGATLQLTLTIPGEPIQTFEQTLSGNTFSFQLGVLPTNTTMYFKIVSIDSNGNTSVIDNVPFLIEVLVIEIPLPTGTPFPLEIPRVEEILQPPPIVEEIIKKLPPVVQEVIESPLAEALAEIIPALVALTPAITTAVVVVQTSASLLAPILEFISRLLQSLGLIPVKRPRGVVYDTKTGQPIPFATITITSIGNVQIIDEVVSDVEGIYRSVKLPPGRYRIEARHSDYTFPTKLDRKAFVDVHDFYKGEEFSVEKANDEPLFLIPMDPIVEKEQHRAGAIQRRAFLFSFKRILNILFYPIVALSVVIFLIYPSVLNLVIVIAYVFMIIWRWRRQARTPALTGTVVGKDTQPLENVIVRISESGSNHLAAILISDTNGRFKTHLLPSDYAVVFTKDEYAVLDKDVQFNTLYVKHGKTATTLTVHMEKFA
jgi:hypothetical protein